MLKSPVVWFVIAVFLAWPTVGLSLLVWAAFFGVRGWLRSQINGALNEQQTRIAAVVEPMIRGRYVELFRAMDIPVVYSMTVTDEDARKCMRRVEQYMVRNVQEGQVFLAGVAMLSGENVNVADHNDYIDVIEAARVEARAPDKGPMHLVVYHGIHALMVNNDHKLACFGSVDLGGIIGKKGSIEMKAAVASDMAALRRKGGL